MRDIRLIRDPRSQRSKGIGYVEFYDAESVLKALALNNIVFKGQPLLVQASMAERNRVAQAAKNVAAASALMGGGGGAAAMGTVANIGTAAAAPAIGAMPYALPPATDPAMAAAAASAAAAAAAAVAAAPPALPPAAPAPLTRLIVSELHPNIGEADVTDVFSPFGALESVTMPTGAEAAAGGGVGVAHVTFKSATDAATARDAMHGLELAERRIQVRLVTAAPPPNAAADPNAALLPPGSGIPAPLPNLLPSLLGRPAGSSMPLAGVDAAAAAAAAAAAMASGVGGAVLADGAGGGGGVSSRYVRVAHMFDPAAAAAAADGYFYDDVEDALADEASRFGHVRRCFAVRGSADGLVVVKFSDADGAAKCAAALHGRWFAGKQLMAAMVDEAEAQRLMGSGGGGDGAAPAASAPADAPAPAAAAAAAP